MASEQELKKVSSLHKEFQNLLDKDFKDRKLKDVEKALKIRNISDTNRKNSPLLKHRDSVVIDTGKLDKQAMLVKMSKTVEKILKNKYGNRTRN